MGYYGFIPTPLIGKADFLVDPVAKTLDGTITLVYPRLSVAASTWPPRFRSAPSRDLGAWFEATVEKAGAFDQTITIQRSPPPFALLSDPWTRAAAGVDHTGASGLYVSLQWVRGLPDEVGLDATGTTRC